MSALDALKGSLSAVNNRFTIGLFGDPKVMSRTAEELERSFGQGASPGFRGGSKDIATVPSDRIA